MVPVARVEVNTRRGVGSRDPKIYGHFLEHFHRQIYGGIFDADSPHSDEAGYRKDVMDALRRIQVPLIRWPGGCFVSAYHWKNGVGDQRESYFDKAWRVVENNRFGTDEFIAYCRSVGAEPYICTNAGTGSPEEMSDWVEYCNLKSGGRWATLRAENGHPEPYNVKYWSIGNENYGSWEMGAKAVGEWGRFVKESAKMMKRVDPTIELLAASISDLDWNLDLLREAGDFLNWISIHGYWDLTHEHNNLSNYETCMAYTLDIEPPILKTKYILGALGYLGKIRIAYDEWNLRGWHHPFSEDYLSARDKNDINSSYTMADAIFNACFLNQCLKHSDVVGMANFAPTVNTRGCIFTHPEGIVLRPTYFVFELYTQHMGDQVVDFWIEGGGTFSVDHKGHSVSVPSLDVMATKTSNQNDLRMAIVNRHPDKTEPLRLDLNAIDSPKQGMLYSLIGDSKDAFNDIAHDGVGVEATAVSWNGGEGLFLEIPPHSVNVLVLT